jgi:transcriptional regulator with XRE-family HTH domain
MNDIELLKDSRKILELTQSKLAGRLNVARITVAQWETGTRSPAPEVFKNLLELVLQRIISNKDRKDLISETVKKLKKK